MPDELYEDRDGSVAMLTLHRPVRRNALNATLVGALRERIISLLADDAVRGLVLAGAGAAFCAGLDLHDIRAHLRPSRCVRSLANPTCAGDASPLDAMLADLAAVYAAIESAGKPVVAAVNGAAVAGGAGLVACCPTAVAAETAKLGFPGVRVGLTAPVLTGPLTRRISPERARQLLESGELLDAEAARACGLVQEVVPAEQCLPRAIALANDLARSTPVGRALPTPRAETPASPAGPADGVLLLFNTQAAAALDRFLGDSADDSRGRP